MDPVLFIGYAPPGYGKSVDAVYAAPDSIWIAEPPAVRHCARSVCGIDIPEDAFLPPTTIEDITNNKLDVAVAKKKQSIVIDDLTLVVQNTFRQLEKSIKDGGKGLDGYPLFGAVQDMMLDLRQKARSMGVSLFVNAHLGFKHLNKLTGRWILGGPAMNGQSQEQVPAAFDMVLRGVRNPSRPVGWTTEWHCADDDDFITKDRLNVVFGVAPMNTSEILRARGYRLPRFPGMEWLDGAIKMAATALAQSGVDMNDRQQVGGVVGQIRAMLPGAVPECNTPQFKDWVIRDAVDRVIIRRTLAERETTGSLFGG